MKFLLSDQFTVQKKADGLGPEVTQKESVVSQCHCVSRNSQGGWGEISESNEMLG